MGGREGWRWSPRLRHVLFRISRLYKVELDITETASRFVDASNRLNRQELRVDHLGLGILRHMIGNGDFYDLLLKSCT